MIAPEKYQRTVATLARGELTTALTARLVDELEDQEAAKVLAQILNSDMAETVTRYSRRQEIAAQALEDVNLLSPPEDATEPTSDVSDEFISHFWSAADRATTKEVRALFARILAKESTKPGSYSASTLNLLAILPPELGKKFDLFCKMSFGFKGFDFVLLSTIDAQGRGTRASSIGTSNKKGEELIQFGIQAQDLLDMRAAALTRSLPEEEYPNLTEFFAQSTVEFAGQNVALTVLDGAPTENRSSVVNATNVISLTRAGSELRTLLALQPEREYKDRLIQVLANAGVSMV